MQHCSLVLSDHMVLSDPLVLSDHMVLSDPLVLSSDPLSLGSE